MNCIGVHLKTFTCEYRVAAQAEDILQVLVRTFRYGAGPGWDAIGKKRTPIRYVCTMFVPRRPKETDTPTTD